MNLPLDPEFVDHWSHRYLEGMPRVEHDLFGDVGPAVAGRGYYRRDEFLAVGRWKTPRVGPRLDENTDEDIEDVTRIALSAPERLQHSLLLPLRGVGVPMATALLAVARPDRHTVLDVRCTEALRRLGAWDGKGGYRAYLAVCMRLASDAGTTLRTLDRALWTWSKAGYPER